MVKTSQEEANADETPAPDATDVATGKPAPASEPDDSAGERDPATGKFKAKEPAEPADTPGVAKRIGKALAAQRIAEARVQELEEQLANPASRPAPAKAAEIAPPAKPAELVEPDSKTFDTYEAYVRALTKYEIAVEKAAEAKTASERKAAEDGAARGIAWNARVEEAKKLPALEDYDEVMTAAAALPISEAMHVTIFESERGPELAYHLASHPDDATRIAKLGPLAAARELGKIEAALPSTKAPAAQPAAKPLPKPPVQAGGNHAPSEIDLNDDKLSQAVFAREFKKRLAADRS